MLTLEQEGAYLRLLCSCWLEGTIPADPEAAAMIIGKGASTTLASKVLTMFEPAPGDPSKMIHVRLEEEREKQRIWAEKSSQGGKKSAAKRYGEKPSEKTTTPKDTSTVVQPPSQGSFNQDPNQNLTLQSASASANGVLPKGNTPPLPPVGGGGSKKAPKVFVKPTRQEWIDYGNTLTPPYPTDEAGNAWDHFESNGWKVGGKAAMKDWQAACRTCHKRWKDRNPNAARQSTSPLARKF
jgi:uncharacterized protein YdaU (DUF1376 family)